MPDRLQQEIDELLAKLDTFPPKRSLWDRMRRSVANGFRGIRETFSGVRLPQLSAGHALLIAIAVIVIAYLALPGTSDVTRWIIAAGIVLFIAAFVISLRKSATGGRPPQRYWRDKPIDLRAPGPANRVRSWWDRRRNRR